MLILDELSSERKFFVVGFKTKLRENSLNIEIPFFLNEFVSIRKRRMADVDFG